MPESTAVSWIPFASPIVVSVAVVVIDDCATAMQFPPCAVSLTLKAFVSIELSPFPSTVMSPDFGMYEPLVCVWTS